MSHPPGGHRSFTDSEGLHWEIREIANPALPPSLEKVMGTDRRRSGWLLFESDTGLKRRLAPYPSDWRQVSDFEIERWCMRATSVPPAPARREGE